MPQVVSVTGMPLAIIKTAKKNGCPAFMAGNRIRLEPLLKWFFAEFGDEQDCPPDGLATWREALNRAQTKREELRLSKEKGDVMDIGEARSANAEAWAFVFAELERLCLEKPPALAGRSAVEIFEQLNAFKEKMRKDAKAKFEQAA